MYSLAYGKQQTSDSCWEILRIENEQKKQPNTILMDKTGVNLMIFM